MGRLPYLFAATIFLLLFDWYCINALLNVFRHWSLSARRRLKIVYWVISIGLIAGAWAAIYLNLFLSLRAVLLIGFFFMVVAKLILLPFLVVDDLRRGIKLLFTRNREQPKAVLLADEQLANKPTTDILPNKETMPRSEFLIKAGLIAAAVPVTSLTWGIVSGAYDYQVRRVKLVLKNLPAAFDGMRIGQISDIHSGSFYNKTAVRGGVDMLMAEKPEVIFFTGDVVNNLATEMRDYQDIFSNVKAPLGVFSILGNHDYGNYVFGTAYSPARQKNLNDVKAVHRIMGWQLLLNEHKPLTVNNESIGVLGIENWGMGRFPRYGRMDLATRNTQDYPVKLLLSHDPSHWRGQVLKQYPQIDAMFSGHTHGMQFGVRLKHWQWSPIEYIYKEWAGLYHQGAQQLYVNVGYGFLGYPGRVGILPEITIFELKRA